MKKRLLHLLFIPLFMIQLGIIAYAAEEDMQQKETSVLQLVVFYTDESGEEHPVQGGTGFLIGEEDSSAEYLITAKDATSVSKTTEEQVVELYADSEKNTQITYEVKAVIKKDVMISVQLIAESDEMGFAIWKLSQPLYDRQALILCDDLMTGVSGQKATVLGFPTAPSLTGDTVYYSMDEMVSKNGMLIGDGKEGNVNYLYHNITPNAGMIGGPVLNEEGNVIAINQPKEAQDGYYALQMSELIPVLEALGIPYITTSEVEERIEAELAAMVHKEGLQQVIQTAESVDSSLYHKKSYAVLEASLLEAKQVNENETATQEEVDAVLGKVNAALEALKRKPPLWMVLLIVFIVTAILVGAFVVWWRKTKQNREQKKQQKLEEMTVTQAAPVFAETTVQKEDYKKLIIQDPQPPKNEVELPQRPDEVYGETTVFQQETGNSMAHAYLIRKRTGEKIIISENEVVLGKDPSQTDYCITGNSAISRVHAVIIRTVAGYDVSDKNATNGTFVNGVKVAAFQKMPLRDGDILCLSDEDFEFRVAADR